MKGIAPVKDRQSTDEYGELLRRHVLAPSEQLLGSAEALGVRLIDQNVNADELAEFHLKHVEQICSEARGDAEGVSQNCGKMLLALLRGYCRKRTDQRSNFESELRQSERRYRTLAESARDSIFIIGLDDRIQYVNAFGARLLGKSPAEVVGLPRSEIFRGPAGEEQREHLHAVFQTGEPREGVTHTPFPDGSAVWLATVLTPIKNDDGGVVGVMGMSRDVTELKLAEEELRVAHGKLEATLNALPDLLFEVDHEGRILDYRAPHPELLYLPPEKFLGKTVAEILPAPAAEITGEAIRQALETGKSEGTTYSLEMPDGTHSYELSIVRSGGPALSKVRLVVLVRDNTERKRVEEALRESEQKHRLFLENFDGIAYQAQFMTFRPILFYGTVEAITGYAAEDFVSGRVTWSELIHSDDLDQVRKMEESLRDTPGYVADSEYRIVTRDGQTRWVRDIGRVICTEDGRTRFIQGAIHDINERKQAEKALRESEERYSALFTGITDAVFVHRITPDGDPGDVIDVNDVACRMLGYSREELLGMKVSEVEAPGSGLDSRRVVEVLKKGRDVFFEQTLASKNGARIPVEIHAKAFIYGGRLAVLSTVRDITERRRAEEALRQSEVKFRGLVESSSDWIWEVNPEGVFTYASPRVETILGYKPEEVVGRTPYDLMPPEEVKRITEIFRALPEKGRPVVALENVCLHKDGRRVVIETNGVSFFDEEGNIGGYRGVNRDITDRKRAQETLRFARDELEIRVAERTAALQAANEKLRSQMTERIQAEQDARRWRDELAHMSRLAIMGEMATGLAHEINQPLGAIKNFAQGALRRMRQAPDQFDPSLIDAVDKISKQAGRAADVVERQRNFIKKGRPRLAAVDLNVAVEQALEFIDHETRGRNVSLNLSLVNSIPSVSADSIQIMQVLLNILRNALDAMCDNELDDRRIDVETSLASGEAVACSIRDSGRACDENDLERIFDAFYSAKEEGLGMGLAISRSIIESHGGRLWAATNPDRGMTFCFTLPTQTSKGTS